MLDKIPTAEEFLKKLDEESGTIWTEDDDSICNALVEFAQLHVEAALKAAAENGKILREETHEIVFKGFSGGIPHYGNKEIITVDKQSILNAYPKTLIK